MKLSPNIALLSTAGAVGASTAILPTITGYGTILSQVVVLGAWGIIAALTSGAYADQHDVLIWIVAFFINIFIYLVPGFPVWILYRISLPDKCNTILIHLTSHSKLTRKKRAPVSSIFRTQG